MRSPSTLTLALALLPLTTASAQNWRHAVDKVDENATRPTLVVWQRHLADAEALSHATGKPLLICVNMNGEPASEVFAGVKYKDEHFVSLMESYIPVILSPDRHNARDYDEQGRRVECPRFGTVTCSEHINAEPIAYAKYFDGQRVCPRHVGVAANGEILFDRFLDQDLSRVDRALREHAAPLGVAEWSELVAVPTTRDLEEIEAHYLVARPDERARMLLATRSLGARGFDLLRLGLADNDSALRARAVALLAEIADGSAVDLVIESLDAAESDDARRLLTATLERLGNGDERAQKRAKIHRALQHSPSHLRVGRWRQTLAASQSATDEPAPGEAELIQQMEALFVRIDADPENAELQLEVARTQLALARLLLDAGRNPTYFLSDAEVAAQAAADAGSGAPEVASVLSQVVYLQGQTNEAADHAVRALALPPTDAASQNTAAILDVLAQARTQAIYSAERDQADWADNWLSEANAAFEILSEHPLGTALQACAHIDLLNYFGAKAAWADAVEHAIERFPESPDVHSRYRAKVLALQGPEALGAAYDAIRPGTETATHDWFAGYARLVSAESQVRSNALVEASATYQRSIRDFNRSVELNPDFSENVGHYVALAHAGRAWIAKQRSELDEAVQAIKLSIETRPESAVFSDGLARTPRQTLLAIQRAAEQAEREDLLRVLETALAATEPSDASESAF